MATTRIRRPSNRFVSAAGPRSGLSGAQPPRHQVFAEGGWPSQELLHTVGKAASPEEALHWLGVDDNLELLLRRLASHIYMERTGDKAGATAMRGVRPPGSASDIAPSWLVGEVTCRSKAERQRAERVAADTRRSTQQERGGARGRGRGEQSGRGGGGSAATGDEAKSDKGRGRGRGGGRGPRKTQG